MRRILLISRGLKSVRLSSAGEERKGRDRNEEGVAKGEERGEKKKEAREMECTRARRSFLVRVIRHDVVEINLGDRDVPSFSFCSSTDTVPPFLSDSR